MPMNDRYGGRRSGPVGVPLLALILPLVACQGDPPQPVADGEGELVWYTSIAEDRARAVADAYREASGIAIRLVRASDAELVARLAGKGDETPADVLTVDGTGDIAAALDADVLRPTTLDGDAVADMASIVDPDGYWFAIATVADAIVYDSGQIAAADLTGYAGLADTAFAGKLCLRRGADERSKALVAALIVALGEREAELGVRGWRSNLARSVFDDEDTLVTAVADGECAVAIAGSDAVLRHLERDPDAELGMYFPTEARGGVQLHPLVAGVSRHAGNADAAGEFIAWLRSAEGRLVLLDGSALLPAGSEVPPPAPLASLWPLAPSRITTPEAVFAWERAGLLLERARYR